ncbi:MAG: hypothetical protein FWB87_13745 [Defluviitaleaceae bacterium]|nr:hypothetical protein [Defluviitaleaceae bacterium]
MNLKAIGALCKKRALFNVWDDNYQNQTSQWLGVAGAMYLLPDLPYLNNTHIANIFDVTDVKSEAETVEKKRSKVTINIDEFPSALCGYNTDRGEMQLKNDEIIITHGEWTVKPFTTSGGTEFIDIEFIKPIANYGVWLEFYERRSKNGNIYIVAKNGLEILAIIMPLRINEEMIVIMEKMAIEARATIARAKEAEERRARELMAGGQLTLTEGENNENN